jgi:probable rRNA maturation factor
MKVLIKNQQRHRHLNRTKITKKTRQILSFLEQPKAELSILFVGDRKMIQFNKFYRGINKTTDVLSFEAQIPVQQRGINNVLGDIVINVPKAETQAKISGIDFYDEIYRLLIHGTLHLLGYDHEGSRYKALKMRKKEQETFNALKKMDSKR